MKIILYFGLLYFIVISSIFTFNSDTLSIYSEKLEVSQNKIKGVEYLNLIHKLNVVVINSHIDKDQKESLLEESISEITLFQNQNPQYIDKSFNKHIDFIKKFHNNYSDEDYYNFFDFVNNINYNIGNKAEILFSEDKEQYLLGSLITHYIPEFFISINIAHNLLEEFSKTNIIDKDKENIYIEQSKLIYLSASEIENIVGLLAEYEDSENLVYIITEINIVIEELKSTKDGNLDIYHKLMTLCEELNVENQELLSSLLEEDRELFSYKETFHTYLLIFMTILVTGIFLYFFRIFNSNVSKDRELKRLNESLLQRVDDEVSRNREKDKQLLSQSRQAQMGEMLSMIAHQWRQPLAAISSTSSGLELKAILGKADSELVIKSAKNISKYSQHLSETINDFRDFFKPAKESEEISFKEIIESVMGIVHVSIENQNIQVIREIQTQEKFKTYTNELKQVLLNLIKNSEDALLEKEIKNPFIKIVSYKEGSSFILEVSDNAGGISEDVIDNIFDPYFSTKLEKNGTGLGLYMSKTIIEDHCGGTINIVNDSLGALFRIKLGSLQTARLVDE